ncbi:hypothetical protein [Gulosibacter sp. 10]|uniref:hypothetical protein n=1 Tax=Gulosibacter sp. 10 TaxID=1255570 RepID=UPI00097F3DB1|nr:hypothetical protein [Gulosibacter sp. 10]SJM69994.1 hypothetical protein FM112_14595 [Gulosibacter sp. 10]
MPSNAPDDKARFWAEAPVPAPHPRPPISDPDVERRRTGGAGLSIAAIGVALFAFLAAVPWPGLSPIPALVGILLAGVGFARRGPRAGLEIAALVVSILALLVSAGLAALFWLTIPSLDA